MPEPPIDYTSKDYESFRRLMLDVKKDRVPEWSSESPGDLGVTLIEAFAYIGDILSYYGDRQANEAYITTAVRRESVLNLARMLNYVPENAQPAEVDVRFTLASAHESEEVTIPAKTRVSTDTEEAARRDEEPVFFETKEEMVIAAAETEKLITCVEGQTVLNEDVGVSDGEVEQRFELEQDPVIVGSIELEVDEGDGYRVWERIEHLINARFDARAYAVQPDENDAITILFGDDVNGRIPDIDALIRATYRVGGGERGNVGSSTIVELIDDIEEVGSVSNPDPATGGINRESISSIRDNAPRSITTLTRAVSEEDYANLALDVLGVVKANSSWDDQNSVVNIYVAPRGGGQPSQNLLDTVTNHLMDKTILGINYSVGGPMYVDVDVSVDIRVANTFQQTQVHDDAELEVKSFLSFDEQEIGGFLAVSELYRRLMDVDGVHSLIMTTFERTADGAGAVDNIDLTAEEIGTVGTISLTMTGGVT